MTEPGYDADLTLPEELATRYIPIRVLGTGGYGRVILAEDSTLNRLVAIKLLHETLQDPSLVTRFQREAQLTSSLAHPHVVPVYDHGLAETGGPYIIYEYVAGPSLRKHLHSGAKITPEDVVTWGNAVGSALARAHEAGVVHRDVKPENILLRDGNHPVLCDFGVARPDEIGSTLTAEGILLGTPCFLAPEIWEGSPPGPLGDQFALAATLYELLYTRIPYPSDRPTEILEVIVRGFEPTFPPDQRPGTERLVAALGRGLSHAPAERYPDMDAFVEALGVPGATPEPPLDDPGATVVVTSPVEIAPEEDTLPRVELRGKKASRAEPRPTPRTAARRARRRRTRRQPRPAMARKIVPVSLCLGALLALAMIWAGNVGDAPAPPPGVPVKNLDGVTDGGDHAVTRPEDEQARRFRLQVMDALERLRALHPGEPEPILANPVAHIHDLHEVYSDPEFLQLLDQLLTRSRRWLKAEVSRGEPLNLEDGSPETRELLRWLLEDLLHHVRDLHLFDSAELLDFLGTLEKLSDRYQRAPRAALDGARKRLVTFVGSLREDLLLPPIGVLLVEGVAVSLVVGREAAVGDTGISKDANLFEVVLSDLEDELDGSLASLTGLHLAQVICRLMIQNTDIGQIPPERRRRLLTTIRSEFLPEGRLGIVREVTLAWVDLLLATGNQLRAARKGDLDEELPTLLVSLLEELEARIREEGPEASRLRLALDSLARTERTRMEAQNLEARVFLEMIPELAARVAASPTSPGARKDPSRQGDMFQEEIEVFLRRAKAFCDQKEFADHKSLMDARDRLIRLLTFGTSEEHPVLLRARAHLWIARCHVHAASEEVHLRDWIPFAVPLLRDHWRQGIRRALESYVTARALAEQAEDGGEIAEAARREGLVARARAVKLDVEPPPGW